jgi:hypothetical protein
MYQWTRVAFNSPVLPPNLMCGASPRVLPRLPCKHQSIIPYSNPNPLNHFADIPRTCSIYALHTFSPISSRPGPLQLATITQWSRGAVRQTMFQSSNLSNFARRHCVGHLLWLMSHCAYFYIQLHIFPSKGRMYMLSPWLPHMFSHLDVYILIRPCRRLVPPQVSPLLLLLLVLPARSLHGSSARLSSPPWPPSCYGPHLCPLSCGKYGSHSN